MALPFIVIDQNRIRCETAISDALDQCHRLNLQLLVPDGAGLEFSKGSDPLGNWRRSLMHIATSPEKVSVSRKISDLWAEELQQGIPSTNIVDNDGTYRFRELIRQFQAGDESGLQQVLSIPNWNSMARSLKIWSKHDENKAMIMSLRDRFESWLAPVTVTELRANPDTALASWLESVDGFRFVFQGIQHYQRKRQFPTSNDAALRLSAAPSVIGAFISGMASLAIHWLAKGGLESSKPSILTNDIIDLEYAVLGSISNSLLSSDKRQIAIHDAIKQGQAGRARWFEHAAAVGPEAA